MVKIILAVDGSVLALAATHSVIKHRALFAAPMDIHLLYVGAPASKVRGVSVLINFAPLDRPNEADADEALVASANLLGQYGINYRRHNLVGDIAAVINEFANAQVADFIYIGAQGRGCLLNRVPNTILGSTAAQLLHAATVPVVIIHTPEV